MRALAAVAAVSVLALSGAAPSQDRPGKGNERRQEQPAATTSAAGKSSTTTSTMATKATTTKATTPKATAKGKANGVKAASAHGLSITTITWDVVGLDSTDVDDGPNVYPVGVRVCATGGAVDGITVSFTWLSDNPYLNLVSPATQSIASLAAGACADRYFFVAVTRTPAAYDTTRAYSVTATAADGTTAVTPTPRQLYVERLLSQNRNTVLGISGPTTVYEGDTVTYTIEASTAPNGYEQLDTFLTMLYPLFSLTDVRLAYETPAGATSRSPYADACGWDPDPTSPSYRSCLGTGRVGGTITGTFTGTVVGLGSTEMSTAIIDVSGSSYHYNADFGTAPNLIFGTALPSADLALQKTALGTFVAGETAQYRLTVVNQGPSASGAPLRITDALPDGMTFVSGSGGGWQCSGATTVTCTRAAALAAGASSSVTITVRVAADAVGSRVNTATVTGPARDLDPADNRDGATVAIAGPGDTGLARGGAGRASRGGDAPRSATAIPITGAADAGPLSAFALLLIGVGTAARRAGRRINVTPAQ